MLRSFKYRLHPTKKQEITLNEWLIHCGQLYNAALEHRINAYKHTGKNVSRFDQHRELTALRESIPEWRLIPVVVQRSPINRVNTAFNNFFRRCKSGATPGFPRFRSTKAYKSFSIGAAKLEGHRVRVPNLGHIRLNLYRPIEGRIKDSVISQDSTRKWWISITCDIADTPVKCSPSTKIGIDLGLTTFAVLSNGEMVANPRLFRKTQTILRKQQQALARKKRDSKTYQKQKIIVAKTYDKIKNQRLDFARKTSCELFNKFDLVAYEDLNIINLATGMFAKSVNDAGWGVFIRCLTLKAENAGKWAIAVNPRGTSQRCSRCSYLVRKDLSERWHNCPSCGLSLGRDHNAAINILNLAWPMPDVKLKVSA